MIYDYIIIGNGFKALATAYEFSKIKQKIKVIYDSKNFYGTMSSLPVNNGNVDIGYQFFDGLNKQSEKFISELCEGFLLKDFGYGAATYTNKQIYFNHAIPNYRSFGFKFSLINFIKLILINAKSKKKYNVEATLEDYFINYPKDLKNFIFSGIKRNYTIEPKYLSYKAKNYTPIACDRITILNSKLSAFLKKNKFFDNFLACKREDLSLDNISLYPSQQNMNDLGIFIKNKLEKKGVEFQFSENINIENFNDKVSIENDEKKILTKKIIYLKDLDSVQNNFQIKFDHSSNFYVPQILYIFEQKNIISEFQYVMGNDLDLLVSRGTNLSLYSKKSQSGNAYVTAEVPTYINSKIWQNPEKFIDIVWENMIKMKLSKSNEAFIDFKIIKAKKTFCLPTNNYEKNLKSFKSFGKLSFQNKLKTIGSDLVGRHDFIIDLLKNAKDEKVS